MTPESQMGGAPPPEQAPQAGGDVNGQIRQLIMAIGQIAQQVPEAQAELGAAAKALTAASLKLVSGQPQPNVGQPIVGA